MNKTFICKNRFIFMPFLAIAFVFLVGFLVMFLWNYTMPAIFGLTTITLWQSMALFFLCKLLFGFGKGPKRGGPPWKGRHRNNKLSELNEVDREKFQQYIDDHRWCWDRSKSKSDGDQPGQVDSV